VVNDSPEANDCADVYSGWNMQWPERFDERLHIFAHGERFDVDAFLARATLKPDFVWRRNAPLTSGIESFLGDGRKLKLRNQENIAIAYLRTIEMSFEP
jgi:hypothetical protein